MALTIARLSSVLALAASALAATHYVTVGGDGTLKYEPEALSAAVGDQVLFTFKAKNHTVTQSSFADPCGPMDGGLKSGFKPVALEQHDDFPTFTVDVKDTNPMWFYCSQGAKTPASHCGKGMVFSINCPTDPNAPNSFENFKKKALDIGKQLADAGTSPTSSSYSVSYTSAPYGSASVPVVPDPVTVTKTVTVQESTWTTTYASYPDSPDPTPSSLEGSVIKVMVGDGGLKFNPPSVVAKPRDTIVFEFVAKNHSVTESTFADPCRRRKDAGTQEIIGFDSGFMPSTGNGPNPTFNITVNETAPIWVYCRQAPAAGPSHCGAGMVFAINAPENSPRNFTAFQSLAQQLNGTVTGAAGDKPPAQDDAAGVSKAVSGVLTLGSLLAAAALLF